LQVPKRGPDRPDLGSAKYSPRKRLICATGLPSGQAKQESSINELIRVSPMKPDTSRFSSFCAMIAVLALVVGIAVTVEAAAQQIGNAASASASASRFERAERQFIVPIYEVERASQRSHYLPLIPRDEPFLGEI
jgi:hypothetical protein